MAHRGGDDGRRDPWQHLYPKASRMRPPTRPPLTSDGLFGRHGPEPEVIEHMLDDLEARMRNYFLLYNREREMRKKAEDHTYRLERELTDERKKLGQAHLTIDQLHSKIRSLVGQPIRIRETLGKIDMLHHQMDTLIQAFVGIGSCATLQGQNQVAFLKLFLEYLHPCRDLDVRLNTLYTAMYSSLSYNNNIPPPPRHPPVGMEPLAQEMPSQIRSLSGISILVHQLLLKQAIVNPEPGSYSCFFRYDHEPVEQIEADPSRRLSADAKPLHNASGIIDFNGCIRVESLPPRVPNVIPKLVLELRTDTMSIGNAVLSIVDEKTLREKEPWEICDEKGNHCGDVIVTIRPIPDGTKLPAVGFARRYDEVMLSTSRPTTAEQTSNFVPTVPDKPVKPKEVVPTPKATAKAPVAAKSPVPAEVANPVPATPFVPTQKSAFRRPLIFKGKTGLKATAFGTEIRKQEGGSATENQQRNLEKPEEVTRSAEAPKALEIPKAADVAANAPGVRKAVEVVKAPHPLTKAPSQEVAKAPLPEPVTKSVPPPPVAPPVAKKEAVPLKPPEPKVVAKLPIPVKGTPPAIQPKTVASSAVPPPPPAAEETPEPKAVPMLAPKIAPKMAPKVAPKDAAPALPPQIVPKDSTPVKSKTPLVVPKVVNQPPGTIVPKAILPKVPPAESAAVPAPGGPLVPIVVKPKFTLKKPVPPKKL